MENTIGITEEELRRYDVLQQEKKEIEQEMKQLKKKFHHALDATVGENQKGEIARGDFCAQRQIRTSTQYEQDSTIRQLEDMQLSDFIIIEKRPDTEKLEAAITLGLVDGEAFENCKHTKTTQAIVVRKFR
ncbi:MULTISPECIES: hypothetical protein [Virgibacillus]|uniref:Uncharacterized protein n=1 Tax=Virgibacillus pantothenticus TaxID=1473 RepID=A0A0L0QT66_VIRPA|nr:MULTISPECIES: hypothetical protein [Virgibacillus]API92001.1 hypothetical protein BKP57_09265 [Virgibacillus sp. 6R]KNE21368.1 hypothetical protein AFK71_06775 [Virgibacillus pantothenticus]MBS7430460.1 hypothetical protein [Virgibacillus sp. 19R1-5]MBU8566398.1 hypothetical protein [Virgibacillus pantothenticus]MBU8600186.1 hypothetical protein [Virgibacillus pantothenticus]